MIGLLLAVLLTQAPAPPMNLAVRPTVVGVSSLELLADYPKLWQPAGTTYGPVLDRRTLTNFSGGQYLVWTVLGDVTIRVTSTLGPNAVVSGLFLGPTTATTANVTYVGTNTATQGNWQGVYGGLRAAVAGVAVEPTFGTLYTWAESTADARALQRPVPATGRVMAAWYGSDFRLNVVTTVPRQLALYAVDFDGGSREQTVELSTSTTSTGWVLAGWELAAVLNGTIVQTVANDTFPNPDNGAAHFRIPAELFPQANVPYTVSIRYRQVTEPDPSQPLINTWTPWVPALTRIAKLADGTLVMQ